MTKKDSKIIWGILLLFSGIYVLLQNVQNGVFIGLILLGIGLYLIISNID